MNFTTPANCEVIFSIIFIGWENRSTNLQVTPVSTYCQLGDASLKPSYQLGLPVVCTGPPQHYVVDLLMIGGCLAQKILDIACTLVYKWGALL
jgi:hypothetical protein